MNTERLQIPNADGLNLAARLDLPVRKNPFAYAVFAHCFTCSKDLKAVRRISRELTQAGIGVLRIDFTGLGQSEGEFAATNFSTNVADLHAAMDYLRQHYDAPSLLIGHSLGGAAVLMAARKEPELKGVVTIGAPAEPQHVEHLVADGREELERTGEAEVNIGGRPFKLRKQFLDDLQQHNVPANIHQLRVPLMIMHSPVDKTVSIENARDIYAAALHPKSFISLDDADHLLSRAADAAYAAQLIAAWSQRYLPRPESKPLETPEQVVAQNTAAEGYTTAIRAGHHSLISDEPQQMGGHDAGPSPYELLNAALGACTAITLRMYAARKEWPLEAVRVHLSHSKVHAEDCENGEAGDKRKIDFIKRLLEFEGDLTGEQRQRLVEIADRCPVHKTLSEEAHIDTRELKPQETAS